MPRIRVLITVKTYPTISEKYKELACTAGLLEDGSWIRLYPVPFRLLQDNQRYAKYEWIEVDVEKNSADPRPESFRVTNTDEIEILSKIGTERNWEERRKIVLEKAKVHTNLTELIEGAHRDEISLAVFRPTEIIGFEVEDAEPDWPADKVEAILAKMKQGSLFEEHTVDDFKMMPKLPKKFYFVFKDDAGRRSRLMIEDWEVGALYWKYSKSPEKAVEMVRQQYYDNFARTKDLHFFLGTTREWHIRRARNPYVIIGAFYPPHIEQLSLL